MNKTDKKNITLIIDCDPGCDDALALLLAIRSNSYNKIIITTVAGNVPVERTTRNARKIASLARYKIENACDIEIYRGNAVSFAGLAPNVTSVHGRDGLGDVPINLYPPDLEEIDVKKCSAVEFLRNLASSPDDKYDLVCIGPLTNIAMALSLTSKPKKLLEKFNKIVVMGGAFKQRGNITPSAEFNFFFDPTAVQVFLNMLKKCDIPSGKVVFVPLDVTERAQLTFFDYYKGKYEIDEQETKKDSIGMWTLCMLQKYFNFHAFGAKILAQDCAFNNCGDKHEFLSECVYWIQGEYDMITKTIEDSRMSGSSGRKKLPRFCYLHDPLAVWYMIKENENILEEATISVHTGNDDMRGTVIIEDEKYSLYNKEPFMKGTEVSYLSPEKIEPSLIKNFKNDLYRYCGLISLNEH